MVSLFWLLLANLVVVVSAGLASRAIVLALFPVLERYALARPNARSSHVTPTAQGGGIAVVGATLVVAWVVLMLTSRNSEIGMLNVTLLTMAVLALAVMGGVDDIRPIPIVPRLTVQVVAAVLLVAALPYSSRALPSLPLPVEQVVLLVGLVWFINLTNFMDGVDGLTVAEFLPMTAALVIVAHLGVVPPPAGVLALALGGALLGFAPFNRHVARLFLGDVGSLAIGALAGWLLIVLAGRGHLVAALLVALYYLADATVTLIRRWLTQEKLSVAHRSHFYQRATANGFSVPEVVGQITRLNVLLSTLAIASVVADSRPIGLLLLLSGGFAVVVVLLRFERGPE